MKIRAIPPTGTTLVLGDDDETPSGFAAPAQISGYDRDTPARVQSSTPTNAPYTLSYFRGLGQPTRSWVTEYYFNTAQDAFVFAEQHGDEVPGSFVLEITNDTGVVFFDAIRVTAKVIEQIGPSVKVQYKFNVGESRLTK